MVSKRRKSLLLPSIQVELIKQFVAGATTRTLAELSGVNRHTATLYFHKLREIITEHFAAEAPFLEGEVEVDESYFGGGRKGKRGRGPTGKVPVFGLLKRGGRVYTVMIYAFENSGCDQGAFYGRVLAGGFGSNGRARYSTADSLNGFRGRAS